MRLDYLHMCCTYTHKRWCSMLVEDLACDANGLLLPSCMLRGLLVMQIAYFQCSSPKAAISARLEAKASFKPSQGGLQAKPSFQAKSSSQGSLHSNRRPARLYLSALDPSLRCCNPQLVRHCSGCEPQASQQPTAGQAH